MSNQNQSRAVGDIVLDKTSQLSMIVQLDVLAKNRLDVFDLGVSLRPRPGVQLAIREPYRVVIPIEQVLQIAEQHGIDFSTRPEPELTELQKLQRDNAKLAERLKALEQSR
jgi:hypothetical protein